MLRARDDDDVGCYHEKYLGEVVVGCCLFGCKFDDGLLSHMDFEILNLCNGAGLKGEMRNYQSENINKRMKLDNIIQKKNKWALKQRN